MWQIRNSNVLIFFFPCISSVWVGFFFSCCFGVGFFAVRLQKDGTIKINLSLSSRTSGKVFLPNQSCTSRVNTKYFKQKLMNFATFPNLSFPWSQHSGSVYHTFCFTDPLCPEFQVLPEAWFKFLMRRSYYLDLSALTLGLRE